jgi:glutaminyl-tRNA synthetase
VKGTIHWVSAAKGVSAEIRLYDHLFKTEHPDDAPAGKTFLDNINPDSLTIVRDAKLEPSLAAAGPGQHYQFERLGYFFTDPVDSQAGKPVFNRTATLRDTWAKESARDS